MHILFADKFPATGITDLLEIGCKVASNPELKADTLIQALKDHIPDILVVRSTRVTEPMMQLGSLSLIVRAGAGVNTIDVPAASRLGVFVANCPGKNAVAVAELAMGLLLSLDRRIPDNVADLRAHKWNKKLYSKAAGLQGRTLGILGIGSIGREVITRARAFGMRVIAWSRSLTDERAVELGVQRASSPLEVARESDAVSVHLALTDDTRNMVDATFFRAMKNGAFFINTSRGEVVDQDALVRAIDSKSLRVALDVYANEPSASSPEFPDPIADQAAVYGTHHIGASTDQAQAAIADETVQIIRAYRNTGEVRNCVNLAQRSPARCLLTVRHRDRVGVLAHVLGEIRAAKINVQEMQNVVFDGAEAACARLRLDAEPDPDLLEKIRAGSDDILALSLTSVDR